MYIFILFQPIHNTGHRDNKSIVITNEITIYTRSSRRINKTLEGGDDKHQKEKSVILD
jgi:hypothetical protein